MLSTLASYLSPATLQFDLAAALVALIALVFSVWSFRNQRRITIETMRTQRDNDVIGWTNDAIDVLVAIEFLLRDWTSRLQAEEFVRRRDSYLATLSATIDKGRLYFPKFALDVIGEEKPAVDQRGRPAILDRLVDIYDLIKDLDPRRPNVIEAVRTNLMLKKRAFISHAQSEVDPDRRLRFLRTN
jgi:hypothetical protein